VELATEFTPIQPQGFGCGLPISRIIRPLNADTIAKVTSPAMFILAPDKSHNPKITSIPIKIKRPAPKLDHSAKTVDEFCLGSAVNPFAVDA
jgi:hypothetical protein